MMDARQFINDKNNTKVPSKAKAVALIGFSAMCLPHRKTAAGLLAAFFHLVTVCFYAGAIFAIVC